MSFMKSLKEPETWNFILTAHSRKEEFSRQSIFAVPVREKKNCSFRKNSLKNFGSFVKLCRIPQTLQRNFYENCVSQKRMKNFLICSQLRKQEETRMEERFYKA